MRFVSAIPKSSNPNPNPCIPLSHPNPPPPSSPANVAAARLDSGVSPAELSRFHAHMLRNRHLRSPFHWNSLARAYLRLSLPRSAFILTVHLLRSGASPDSYTLPIALKSAAALLDLAAGRQIHDVAVKLGLARHQFCESGIISLYCKAGEFEAAREVFDENPNRRLGSWNALINSLAQSGRSAEAVAMFLELRREGLFADDVTMVSVASACGALGDLALALQVHKCAVQLENHDVKLPNSLIDMYSKCGRTDLARRIFARMPMRDVSSWTAMISGLAAHGAPGPALDLFNRMQLSGVRPNEVTMVVVLTACAHGGLADKGMALLKGMADGELGVSPTVAHYGCAVDMLGKAGRVEEARVVVEEMMPASVPANAVIYGTLLGACERHGDVRVGKWAAERLAVLEPGNDGVYVVMSNIYAAAGMWGEVERVRGLMKGQRVVKTAGYSSATTAADVG